MKLGEYQKLKVIKKVEFGIYLAEHEGDETRVVPDNETKIHIFRM